MNRHSSFTCTSRLLLLLTVSMSSENQIHEEAGRNVTLKFRFTPSLYPNLQHIIWVRVADSPCGSYKKITKANSQNENFRKSARYQPEGQISQGDSFLTILKAEESDSGMYCCVVETADSFYFFKYNLTITKAPPATTQTPVTDVKLTDQETTKTPTKTDSGNQDGSQAPLATAKAPVHSDQPINPEKGRGRDKQDPKDPDFFVSRKDVLELTIWILVPVITLILGALTLLLWRKIKATGSFTLFQLSNDNLHRRLWENQASSGPAANNRAERALENPRSDGDTSEI